MYPRIESYVLRKYGPAIHNIDSSSYDDRLQSTIRPALSQPRAPKNHLNHGFWSPPYSGAWNQNLRSSCLCGLLGPNFTKLDHGSCESTSAILKHFTATRRGCDGWEPPATTLRTSPFPRTNNNYNPEGPSTQYLSSLVPNTIQSMVFGTRSLKYWLLGPSG